MIAGGSRDLAHRMDGRKAVQDAETNHCLIVMESRRCPVQSAGQRRFDGVRSATRDRVRLASTRDGLMPVPSDPPISRGALPGCPGAMPALAIGSRARLGWPRAGRGRTRVRTKKIVNDGALAVDEMLEGIVAAHPAHLAQVPGSPRAVVARQGPRPGKVGLVIGGGSGHEPSFVGFVGRGLADAAAVGNVFASPPPDPILECTKAVSGGAGVLYMYGNYAGDVMNFDMAAEMAAMEEIEVRTVLTTDDIASAPRDRRERRRGVAGNFFIFKAAGAACDRGLASTTWSGWRGGRTTGPSQWGWRWRPARCRRPGGRTSRSARTRWRSAWASTASRGGAGAAQGRGRDRGRDDGPDPRGDGARRGGTRWRCWSTGWGRRR